MYFPHRQQARLLPWSSPGGKPCYVIGDGNGPVSRLADEVEAVQLGMAAALLGHAGAMLDDRRVSNGELRFLVERLTEALRDVLRIAESRGAGAARPAEDRGDHQGQGHGG
ncbi:hypothetical protein QT196_14825 [Streptomyces sp. P9-2B-2]|uniref:hypothetical protein n=1 Tax=Streptomyces sp. P9-2B-2 TaxID=3057114 RepID=UPI0025B3CDC1|nr:hypothetical protein [Streptomyces sp. P9-2B-2]WJY38458.1 hypothetical protein QT196_14825 [Streptomyces sp. P9-2B-2]